MGAPTRTARPGGAEPARGPPARPGDADERVGGYVFTQFIHILHTIYFILCDGLAWAMPMSAQAGRLYTMFTQLIYNILYLI